MHSSADVAVDSLITVDLGRCFPDLRKQTQFKQVLSKKKERGLSDWKRCLKRENPAKKKLFRECL